MCAKSFELCLTLQPYGLQPTKLLFPWYSPGKNTGVGCYPSPGDLPDPVIEHRSSVFPALTGRFFTTSFIWEA